MSDGGDETSRYRAAWRERLDNHILRERQAKAEAVRAAGGNPWANGFAVSETAAAIHAEMGARTAEELEGAKRTVRVAGRVRLFRRMGKACFLKLQDRTSRPGLKGAGPEADNFLQVFVSQANVGPEGFERILVLDLGDIVGVEGNLMRTRTGELSVAATRVELLTKAIRPPPEKFRGLTDVEQRFRQRYVDLMMNEDVREIFHVRAQVVRRIREFLDARGFLEVETPMMHSTPGGAAARPFVTHHNALDMQLYMRIAPELYLKRLLVGGFERVYEINRNFRNEGLSRKHNPEFTMLEFYQAYATYEDLMGLTEELICGLAKELRGADAEGRIVTTWEGQRIDLTPPWRRVSVRDAVAEALGLAPGAPELSDRGYLTEQAAKAGLAGAESQDDGKLLLALFEAHAEHRLLNPTFVVDYPASTSPLARRKEGDPSLVDRFELFVMGREIANAFSELNDPEDQYVRFAQQLDARAAGDEEAMAMDADYVRALEYGMPPAAGEGIGIDRLVMLLTDSDSIREVILFPQMRPEEIG